MDLITNIIGSILAFAASVIGNIWAHDICVSADRICARIIRKAAGRLATFDRKSGEAEWLADLQERETVRQKYQHAIGCFFAAGTMRRQAETVRVAISFQITGVGTVPLSLNLNSRVVGPLFFKTMALKPFWIKKTVVILAGFYLLIKFLRSAHATLPAGFKISTEQLKQYKTWGYGARIKRKGLDLDFGNIFQTMVLRPTHIKEIIEKIHAGLEIKGPATSPPSSEQGT